MCIVKEFECPDICPFGSITWFKGSFLISLLRHLSRLLSEICPLNCIFFDFNSFLLSNVLLPLTFGSIGVLLFSPLPS